MKLNLWQWLGLGLLVVGLALYAYKKSRPAETTPSAPAATPATAPR
jgi:hypothetical protein